MTLAATYLVAIGILVYLAVMLAAMTGLGWLLSRRFGESPVVYIASAVVVLVALLPPLLYVAGTASGVAP